MTSTQPRTILVTGGAGFIGSHVADAYLAEGHRVHILDDLSSGSLDNVPSEAEFHQFDIRSEPASELIRRIRPDVLSHHAAQMDVRRSTEDPRFDADVNILGTLNLLEACVDADVRQVIFASTGGAIYGEQEYFPADENHPTRPVSPYGVSKLACERYLYYYHHAQPRLDVTCLRYANVYGERQSPRGEAGVIAIFLQKILDGATPVINGDGGQTRDYIHVSDLCTVNVLALGVPGHNVLNVGTGTETTVLELARLLRQTLRVETEFDHGPSKPGEQRRSCISSRKLREQLGSPPPIGLAEGIAKTSRWFVERANL